MASLLFLLYHADTAMLVSAVEDLWHLPCTGHIKRPAGCGTPFFVDSVRSAAVVVCVRIHSKRARL